MAKHATQAGQLTERRLPTLEPIADRFALDAVIVRRTPRLSRLLATMPRDERQVDERGQR